MATVTMFGKSRINNLCLFRSKIASHFKRQPVYTSATHDRSEIGHRKQDRHGYISYKELHQKRRSQAKRSILIITGASVDVPYIYKHCMQFGKIQYICHFKDEKHKVLVEYASRSSVAELLSNVGHFIKTKNIPVQSRLLHYQGHETVDPDISKFRVFTQNNHKFDLYKLHLAESLSDQMQMLHSSQKIRDLDSRLYFLVCSYLEDAISGMFPHCRVAPFGSSVNGFGKSGCDLDMEVNFLPKKEINKQQKISKGMKFRTANYKNSDREFAQQMLHLLGDIIGQLLPSCIGVHQILNARVPIVKFFHTTTSLECDLAFKNPSAAMMSELLYFLGEFDNRVRPLVATVKEWAQAKNLTRNNPGPWPTNFTLTMMVLFFLQSRRQPILPTFKQLQNRADPADSYFIDGVNYGFSTDPSRIPVPQNDDDLGELLMEFFNFFSTFDFHKYALSLQDGSVCAKPDYSPLHIPNLFEQGHNISRNVNESYLRDFRDAFEMAVYNLETKPDHKTSHWGLLSLLHPHDEPQIHIKINEIFSQTPEEDSTVLHPRFNSDTSETKSNNSLSHEKDSSQQTENIEHSKISVHDKTVDMEVRAEASEEQGNNKATHIVQ